MKDSVYYLRRVIWTDSDVFHINEFTYDNLDYDEWDFIKPYQHWESSNFYWKCNYWYRERRRIQWVGRKSSKKVSGEWFVYKTREVQVEG